MLARRLRREGQTAQEQAAAVPLRPDRRTRLGCRSFSQPQHGERSHREVDHGEPQHPVSDPFAKCPGTALQGGHRLVPAQRGLFERPRHVLAMQEFRCSDDPGFDQRRGHVLEYLGPMTVGRCVAREEASGRPRL